MSFIINSTTHVDEKYSPILEKVYFMDNVLIPGATYTSKYQIGPAGQIFVHKLKKSAITPSAPGGDFSTAAHEDELIPIQFNYEFKDDRKILGITEAMVEYNRAAAELEMATESVKESRQKYAIAELVNGGTAMEDTDAVTAENVEAKFLAARKQIRNAGGRVTGWVVSTDIYNALLTLSPKYFTPELNEQYKTMGVVGRIYGAPVIEANMLDGSVTLLGGAGAVDLSKLDFVALDAEAYSVLDALQVARIKDSEQFFGSRAQVQTNSAFKVTNKDLVAVKKHV